jgi:hypothetical protein
MMNQNPLPSKKHNTMSLKNTVLPILLSTIWISLCEFLRNQFWLFSYWTDHYIAMGLNFPAEPLNGAVWGIWALVFSIVIYIVSKRFSLLQATLLLWVAGFVMMWLVTGNMGVLPFKILYFAVPLSVVEVFGAVWIMKRLSTSRDVEN